MDTLIFLLILAALLAVALDKPRPWVIGLLLASTAASLLMFDHHVTSPLGYSY
ncbi:DUF5993 family protein [Streptomyces sp. NPDC058308]|uniref:DUF5993 family protein n=1 Tax=Streptomyces sp. NPDC058308 TaxID=3346440 RepID=UPI0036F0BAD0